ncbi:hypothetical protein GCM10007856_22240 [Azospirillum oryzae]|nr:hypothetical protein GCM10007856_22240 [Azospirillum oryzae]
MIGRNGPSQYLRRDDERGASAPLFFVARFRCIRRMAPGQFIPNRRPWGPVRRIVRGWQGEWRRKASVWVVEGAQNRLEPPAKSSERGAKAVLAGQTAFSPCGNGGKTVAAP